jgi:hypothetical protein
LPSARQVPSFAFASVSTETRPATQATPDLDRLLLGIGPPSIGVLLGVRARHAVGFIDVGGEASAGAPLATAGGLVSAGTEGVPEISISARRVDRSVNYSVGRRSGGIIHGRARAGRVRSWPAVRASIWPRCCRAW